VSEVEYRVVAHSMQTTWVVTVASTSAHDGHGSVNIAKNLGAFVTVVGYGCLE